jgi:hypothetical protein
MVYGIYVMDDNMNPATTPGPQAAQRQGASANPCNQGEMPVARKSGPCAAWCGARSSNQDTPVILAACPDTCGFLMSSMIAVAVGACHLYVRRWVQLARGPGPTATWGYTASVAAVSRQVKGRLTDARGESAGLLPSGGRYLPTIAPSPTTSPVRWLVVGHPGRTTYPPQGQRPGCP